MHASVQAMPWPWLMACTMIVIRLGWPSQVIGHAGRTLGCTASGA